MRGMGRGRQEERAFCISFGADRLALRWMADLAPALLPAPRHRVRQDAHGTFATEAHTLAALGILERPILCKHLRLRDGGLPRHPSWHLGAS